MATEVGKVSLGVVIDGKSLQSQEPEIRKIAQGIGGRSGTSLMKGLASKVKSGGKSLSSVLGMSGNNAASGFVSKLLKGITGSSGKITGAFTKLAAGAVAGFAAVISAGIAMAFSAMNFGDNVDKMSQKIGISRKAYQEWAHIMEHCGSNVDVLQTGMKTLSSSVQSESESLKKLGINTKEALGMSTEDLFNTVISRLQDMESGTERTAIASKLFGRSATEMGAVLNMSSADMEAMKQNLHEMGAVMSDQAVADAAAMKDSIQDLKAALGGIKNTIGAAVMPAITALVNGCLIPAAKAIAAIARKIAAALSVIGGFIGAVLGLGGAAGKTTGALGALGSAGTAAVDGITDATADAINGVTGVGGAAKKSAGKAKKAVQDLKRTLEGFDQITKVKAADTSSGGGGGAGGGGGSIGGIDTVDFESSLETIESRGAVLSEKLQALADKIRGFFQGIVDYLSGWYNQWIAPVVADVKQTFSDCWTKIKEGYDTYLQPVFDRLKAKWDEVVENHIKPLMDDLGQLLSDLWYKVLKPIIEWVSEHIMPVLSPIIEAIGTLLVNAIQWAVDKLDSIVKGFQWLIDKIQPAIDLVKSIVDWFKQMPGDAKTNIKLVKDAAFDKIKDAWDSIKDKVAEIKAKVAEWKDELKEKVIDFKAKMATWGDSLKEKIIDFKAKMASWSDSLKDKAIGFGAKLISWWDELKKNGYTKSLNFGATLTSFWDQLKANGYTKALNFCAKLTSMWDQLKANGYTKALNFGAKIVSWWDELTKNGYTKSLNFGAKLTSFWDQIKQAGGQSKVLGFVAKIIDFTDNLVASGKKKVIDFVAKITGHQDAIPANQKVLSGWKAKVSSFQSSHKASGGVYDGGRWRPIQQYASGGSPDSGQLFVAREAGPELVGTLGGHTAVMNNNQIVASVSSGVAKAISGVRFYSTQQYTPQLAMIESHAARQTASLESMAKQAEMMGSGGNMSEMLRIMRDILVVLNEIMDQPVYLDGQDIRKRIVSLINAHTQATGRCEIVT